MLETFRARVRPEHLGTLVQAFEGGLAVSTGEDVASSAYVELMPELAGLSGVLGDLEVGESPAAVASAVEFVLEGMHLTKRLNKDAVAGRTTYRGRA